MLRGPRVRTTGTEFRRRGGLHVALGLLAILVVVATGALLGRTAERAVVHVQVPPSNSAGPSPGVSHGVATPIVGIPPAEWPLPAATATDPDWAELQRSGLYAVEIPQFTGCPDPVRVSTMADLETEARAQMACIQQAWRPVLEQGGYHSHEIPVYFYTGDSVRTPCGEVRGPAVYCAARGGAVYFGEGTLRGSSWYELGVKGIAGHEYGHHLQALAGLFGAEARIDTHESSRRLELQATCLAYAMIARDDSVEMTAPLYRQSERFLRAVVEDDVHGSKESVLTWGVRGLYSEVMGDCNTWVADAESVS